MQIVLITGAANGIGLALTKIYLQQDAKVIMVDSNVAKLNAEACILRSQFQNRVITIPCDISQIDSVKKITKDCYSQVDRIDIIYNNAGIIGTLANLWELPPEQIQQVINVNVYGMIYIIQTFMPYLLQQNHPSHIVNMASMYGLCSGSQNAAYAMSKHAVLALSESLYYDIKRLEKPINVSVAFPSFTDTGLLAKPSTLNPDLHEALNSLLSHSRPAEDVAKHIINAVQQKQFYIFPDIEVKAYAEERVKAMVLQESPYENNVERLMNSLIKRKQKSM